MPAIGLLNMRMQKNKKDNPILRSFFNTTYKIHPAHNDILLQDFIFLYDGASLLNSQFHYDNSIISRYWLGIAIAGIVTQGTLFLNL